MDNRLTEHLKLLTKYLSYLESFKKTPQKKYLSDFTTQGASERYLQLSIESCINIGNRILALQRDNIKVPENYAEIFLRLGELGIYPSDFALKLVNMAKFRNKLVHGYWEIDPTKVYSILQKDVQDIFRFKDYILLYLQENTL